MKTLTEVEPRIAVNAVNTPGDANSVFQITSPGSYYLTGNVTGQPGKHGIEIEADGVTLDLSGFVLAGIAGTLDGIHAGYQMAPRTNVSVRNGTVREWGGSGVNLGYSTYSVAHDLQASLNGADGLVAGSGSRVERCTADRNTGAGIVAGVGSTIVNCVARGNDTGIVAVSSLFRGNTATNNGENINALGGSTLVDNHAPF